MTQRETQRAERLTALHAQLTAAVQDLATSVAWRRMLEVAARLPTYSPSNVLLISVQRPDATRVAGFQTWKTLGRSVRKGEKGIAVLAPCLYRAVDGEPMADPVANVPRRDAVARELRGFRVVHVFDISQTDGEPLPDVAPELMTGRAPEHLWDRLVDLVEDDGFAVERGDCRGANGYTRFDDRTVRVRDDIEPAQAVKTLAHELGHIRAEHESRFADEYHRSVACRGVAEVEAESIAYLVTATAGLESAGYSVPYVAGWADGNADLLRETATRVVSTAAAIERALNLIPERSVDGFSGRSRTPVLPEVVPAAGPQSRALR
ncbi:MAG: ssDNA-binding domain-containing protein [Actinobacteria bacterium]|nr:ssDNA-binding domain-containing protein [Actinomycetota bacterium]